MAQTSDLGTEDTGSRGSTPCNVIRCEDAYTSVPTDGIEEHGRRGYTARLKTKPALELLFLAVVRRSFLYLARLDGGDDSSPRVNAEATPRPLHDRSLGIQSHAQEACQR